jgi:acetolactate synthase regulatory subunit
MSLPTRLSSAAASNLLSCVLAVVIHRGYRPKGSALTRARIERVVRTSGFQFVNLFALCSRPHMPCVKRRKPDWDSKKWNS